MRALSRRLDRLEGPKRHYGEVDERLRRIFSLNPDGTFGDSYTDKYRGRHFNDVMTAERFTQMIRDINRKPETGDQGA